MCAVVRRGFEEDWSDPNRPFPISLVPSIRDGTRAPRLRSVFVLSTLQVNFQTGFVEAFSPCFFCLEGVCANQATSLQEVCISSVTLVTWANRKNKPLKALEPKGLEWSGVEWSGVEWSGVATYAKTVRNRLRRLAWGR